MKKLTPLDLSKEQIEEFAEISEEDIMLAMLLWEKTVANKFKNVLLAEVTNENPVS